jgi:GH18 family chitinase
MQEWVNAGIAKSKLVVGLPLYGRGWMLSDSSSRGLSAPAIAPITVSVYTKESGSWPYFEICQRMSKEKAVNVFDTRIQAAYAYTATRWMGYDDIQTVTVKVKIREKFEFNNLRKRKVTRN